jgi:hypothetical protein
VDLCLADEAKVSARWQVSGRFEQRFLHFRRREDGDEGT